MELLATKKCPSKCTTEIKGGSCGGQRQAFMPSHSTRQWSSFWVWLSWLFALKKCDIKRFKTLWGLEANYFVRKCEHYTQKPEPPEEAKAKHVVAVFCTSLESRAPFYSFTVFLLIWKVTRALLMNIWDSRVPLKGWREGGPREGSRCGSQRGRTGSGTDPVWLSRLSCVSRLLIGMNVLWNIYCLV